MGELVRGKKEYQLYNRKENHTLLNLKIEKHTQLQNEDRTQTGT